MTTGDEMSCQTIRQRNRADLIIFLRGLLQQLERGEVVLCAVFVHRDKPGGGCAIQHWTIASCREDEEHLYDGIEDAVGRILDSYAEAREGEVEA